MKIISIQVVPVIQGPENSVEPQFSGPTSETTTWGVYKRFENGQAMWDSDHETEALADVRAEAMALEHVVHIETKAWRVNGIKTILQAAAEADAALINGGRGQSLTAPIEIIVGGSVHCGKTLIKTIISNALKDFGFTNVQLFEPEENPRAQLELAEAIRKPDFIARDAAGTKEFLGKTITLREASPSKAPVRKPMVY